MYCQGCGMEVASSYRMCPKCGGRDLQAARPGQGPAPVSMAGAVNWTVNPGAVNSGTVNPSAVSYASFWRRLGAITIDSLLILGLKLAWLLPALVGGVTNDSLDSIGDAGVVVDIAGFFVAWLYCALMESSKYQATLGKRWLGLKVVDEAGARISFGRATGRFFGKSLSSLLLCIGYLMVFWTQRRQGLHDKMAKTLVLYVGKS